MGKAQIYNVFTTEQLRTILEPIYIRNRRKPIFTAPEWLDLIIASDKATSKYLFDTWFESGYRCPNCGAAGIVTSRYLWKCSTCRVHQFSILNGTAFESAKITKQIWLKLIWLYVSSSYGINATKIKDDLGIKSSSTLVKCMEVLRNTASMLDSTLLLGNVIVTTSKFRTTETMRSKTYRNRPLIALACQISNGNVNRVKVRAIRDEKKEPITAWSRSGKDDAIKNALRSFVTGYVAPGSSIWVYVDRDYQIGSLSGYRMVEHFEEINAEASIKALNEELSKYIMTNYRGALKSEYMDALFDEFAFRYNMRTIDPEAMFKPFLIRMKPSPIA